MPTSQQTQQICAIFQRALKNSDYTDVNKISLEELQNADIDLGSSDLNSKHRLALKHRIKELKEKGVDDIAKKRHLHTVVISVLSIAAAVCIAIIGWWFFS